jgi:hypothetical protein
MTELQIAVKAVQMYAETHPRPVHVTQKLAAEMLNLSEQTVGKMVKTGRIKLNDCGMIPITEIDRVLQARD